MSDIAMDSSNVKTSEEDDTKKNTHSPITQVQSSDKVAGEGCTRATISQASSLVKPGENEEHSVEAAGEEPGREEASVSQPSSLAYSGDNEEEYLRATWQRLGVGHDGYLSLDELATVCHAIGMEKVANEVLEQLFSRLDVDGDGRISFEEFVHMFQSGGPSGNSSLALDESISQEVAGPPKNRINSVSDDRRGLSVVDSSVLSSLDPNTSGYALIEHILEAWESQNISNGLGILRELGFAQRNHEPLCLKDLAAVLEDECRVGDENDRGTVAVTAIQLAALTYLHEVKYLRLSLDCARGERDKLRQDLIEANQRLTILAQELDEHSAQVEAKTHHQLQELERQYREQVREVQEAAGREREAAQEQVSAATSKALAQANLAHQEEARCKVKLVSLASDVKRLETENTEISEKLQETEKLLFQMEKQVADMQMLKTKVAEYESRSPHEEEYQRLVEQLECVMLENQQLRDKNDELISQFDFLPSNNIKKKSDKEVSLDGSCLGDYVETDAGSESSVGLTGVGLPGPLKRRGSNSASGEDTSEDESPRGSKVRRCSRGLNVHYVDVGSYDESFLETSIGSFLKNSPSSISKAICTQQSPSLNSAMSLQHVMNDGIGDKTKDEMAKPNISSGSQLINKELKQIFNKIRTSVIEEYKCELKEASCSTKEKEENADDNHDIPSRFPLTKFECEEFHNEQRSMGKHQEEMKYQHNQLSATYIHDKCSCASTKTPEYVVEDNKKYAVLIGKFSSCLHNLTEKIKQKRIAVTPKFDSNAEEDIEERNENHEHKEKESSKGSNFAPQDTIKVDCVDTVSPDSKLDFQMLEEQIVGLEADLMRERDDLEKERASLLEKNNKLEHDLEILREEFERSEDYWSLKLQEEQDYYEEERRLYDDKFSALERKIREYEELVLSGSGGGTAMGHDQSDDSDRLSTIDESAVWEKQVTELEEEVTLLRKQSDQLQEERCNMEKALESRMAEERHKSSQECNGLQNKLNILSSQLEQAQFQLTTVLEEMDKVKRESKQQMQELINQQQANIQGARNYGEETIAVSLRLQLQQSQERLKYLENALKQHHTQAHHILTVTREQHSAEVQNLESMIVTTQQMLGQHIAKYKDQLTKASRRDRLVKELFLENSQLMRALQITENRQKSAEEVIQKLQIAALDSYTLS